MTVVNAVVAGEIVLDISTLPEHALESIQAGLTFKNEDKEKAAAERVHGWWDLPDTISLYKEERTRGGGHNLRVPRGYAAALVAGMAGLGHEITWDDRRVDVPAAPGYYRPFTLRDYQFDAAMAMLQSQQGFYECPAGGGKTVTALGTVAWFNQRALIIVDKAGLLEQWRTRAAQFFDFPMEEDEEGRVFASLDGDRTVGKIGENVWEERDLTIALRQTLWSREWENKATKWWRTWGFTGFDEGHHLGAETLGELSRSVESRMMVAFSATPSKSETHGQVVHALIGPIVHRTTRAELYERGVLMRPTVIQIDTGFETPFWVTHDAEFDTDNNVWKCRVPGCKKKGQHMHKNNYTSALKKLVEDEKRNRDIAAFIVARRGHIHLVPSRQLKHLTALKKACIEAGWPEEHIWMLRGEENAAGLSQQIAQEVGAAHEAIIFSTVADEGLDIPPIDHTHVVFPMKQESATIQLVGRGERVAEGKEATFIVDWTDPCEPFITQASERDRVYRKQGFAYPAKTPEMVLS